MKKISFCLLGVITLFLHACSFIIPPKKHTNQFIYLWTKPVSVVDTTKIDSKKTYLVEAYLSAGDPILVFIKGTTLKEVMRLKWFQGELSTEKSFEGKAFTAGALGRKSFLTLRKINKGNFNFDDTQKELLRRYRRREKFELLSSLPFKVRGKIDGEKIVLTEQLESQQWKTREQIEKDLQ